uniref:Indoleamine 2,3-dioxygenase 2-like n=1 Tax=Pundamilia nyererei TaxID=303518 RepID=A0A3B4F912_9CICH
PADMETNSKETLQADFDVFDISEEFGFLLEEPLVGFTLIFSLLMMQCSHLRQNLITIQMPVLSPDLLSDHRELRLAHLALGFISMGYVWQEGQHAPILPKALALPFWLVSRRLGLPPILTYADSVLANWKLKDPTGNMDLIFSFPGGDTCRGFFIVSLLVEMAASPGIMVISDLAGIKNGLIKVTQSLKKMKEKFKFMHNHVEPAAFHGKLRIFVSGWRNNPMLPRGVMYEGVSDEPILLSGGSAAQSSAIQCFDALLCIQHEEETAFLTRMRDYMPPAHRQLIETLSVCPPLRDFILSCSNSDLCQAYNSCVSALVDLRNYHLNTVTKYVIIPGNHAQSVGCPFRGVGTALNTTGTGGSNLMVFLKSVRNTTQKALILERLS